MTQWDGPWGARSWTYDQIGNRLTKIQDSSTDTYTYVQNAGTGNTPILQQVQLAVSGTRDYAYSPAGNLGRVTASANDILYTFDSAGRLSRLDRDAGSVSAAFSYDRRSFLTLSSESEPSGLLIDSFESGDAICWSQAVGGAVTAGGDCSPQPLTRSTYSSSGLLHHLAKQDGGLEPVTDHYVFYFAGRPVAQLALDIGGTPSWLDLTTDHLGTPVVATAAESAPWEGGFEPFGADYSGAQAAGVFLRFPGQWQDGSWEQASLGSEQAYNVHRWFATSTGRFLKTDPAGLPGPLDFDETFLNLYEYAASNPVRRGDVVGLISLPYDSDIPDRCRKRWERKILPRLKRLTENEDCTSFFCETLNTDLESLINDLVPLVITRGGTGGSFRCFPDLMGKEPDLAISNIIIPRIRVGQPTLCRGSSAGTVHVLIHEAGHFADCFNNNNQIKPDDHSDGCGAEVACLGGSIGANCPSSRFPRISIP